MFLLFSIYRSTKNHLLCEKVPIETILLRNKIELNGKITCLATNVYPFANVFLGMHKWKSNVYPFATLFNWNLRILKLICAIHYYDINMEIHRFYSFFFFFLGRSNSKIEGYESKCPTVMRTCSFYLVKVLQFLL